MLPFLNSDYRICITWNP